MYSDLNGTTRTHMADQQTSEGMRQNKNSVLGWRDGGQFCFFSNSLHVAVLNKNDIIVRWNDQIKIQISIWNNSTKVRGWSLHCCPRLCLQLYRRRLGWPETLVSWVWGLENFHSLTSYCHQGETQTWHMVAFPATTVLRFPLLWVTLESL